METHRLRRVLRWKIQVIIIKKPTEICRRIFSMETLETTWRWIMLEVSGHGEVWRVLVASLGWEGAALRPHGSLHAAGSPWPGSHHHGHGIWGRQRGALRGTMCLSSAAVLPAVIILSHNIMFSNRPSEPPATGHLRSCSWAVCKWIPLRSIKNVPKIASDRHFLMSSWICCLFFWISLFSVGQDGFWTSLNAFLALVAFPDDQGWELPARISWVAVCIFLFSLWSHSG